MKPPVPKFRSDLSIRLRDIAEKQVPAKLKPIVSGNTQRLAMTRHISVSNIQTKPRDVESESEPMEHSTWIQCRQDTLCGGGVGCTDFFNFRISNFSFTW